MLRNKQNEPSGQKRAWMQKSPHLRISTIDFSPGIFFNSCFFNLRFQVFITVYEYLRVHASRFIFGGGSRVWKWG